MSIHSVKFNLHGVIVEISFDDYEVGDVLLEYLRYYKITDDPKSNIVITFQRNDPSRIKIPEDALHFFSYYDAAGFVKDDVYYYSLYDGVFKFDPKSSRVDVAVSDGLIEKKRYFTHGIFTIVLMEALRYHGLYYLHGAALVNRRGESLVVTGDSATGKTTMAVSLIHNGWNWLTDDTLLLKRGAGGLEMFSFAREFHIPPALSERMEDLRFLLKAEPYFSGNPKRALKGEEIYGDRKASSINKPDVILFSKIVDAPESEVEKIGVLDALNGLIRTCPFVLFSIGPAKDHLETLREMVTGTRSYRLYAGRDMLNDPVSAVKGILKKIGMD